MMTRLPPVIDAAHDEGDHDDLGVTELGPGMSLDPKAWPIERRYRLLGHVFNQLLGALYTSPQSPTQPMPVQGRMDVLLQAHFLKATALRDDLMAAAPCGHAECTCHDSVLDVIGFEDPVLGWLLYDRIALAHKLPPGKRLSDNDLACYLVEQMDQVMLTVEDTDEQGRLIAPHLKRLVEIAAAVKQEDIARQQAEERAGVEALAKMLAEQGISGAIIGIDLDEEQDEEEETIQA